jgi:hypothetical protein
MSLSALPDRFWDKILINSTTIDRDGSRTCRLCRRISEKKSYLKNIDKIRATKLTYYYLKKLGKQ